MKSFFLLTLVLFFTMSQALLAQTTRKKVAVKVQAKTIAEPELKSSFDKFYDRLKIGYFGAFASPHVQDIKHSRYKNAAVSPEWGAAEKGRNKNHDTWATNIWSQISFNFNFGAKMNFIVNPRFATPFASPTSMKAPEDRSFIMIDDVLVGFQGVVLSSTDKKFNLWVRPGVRLPTSRASRNAGNAGAGRTTNQLELTYLPTYDFTKTWGVGLFGQLRQWVVEDQYGMDRFRIMNNPYIQYTIDDLSKIQVYYELILETDRRGKPADDRDPVFKERWQNISAGYSRSITPKLNVFPFLGCFVNDKPVTDKSLWVGAWISYQIK